MFMENKNTQDSKVESENLSKQDSTNDTISQETLQRYTDFFRDRASKDQTLSEDQKKKLLDQITPKMSSL